jgi:hypothetical protein
MISLSRAVLFTIRTAVTSPFLLLQVPHLRNFAVRISQPGRILFNENDLIEQFVRGGGSGGQSVARTANCVVLKHVPTGIVIRCHATRSRDLNRRGARKELQMRLDDMSRGSGSVRGQKIARKVKKKAKSRSRAKAKYGVSAVMVDQKCVSPPVLKLLPVPGPLLSKHKKNRLWPFSTRITLSLRFFQRTRRRPL